MHGESVSAPQAHLVVYHVDFHGATHHMENHVVKVDKFNHDKNHVVIHMVLMKPKRGIANSEISDRSNKSNQMSRFADLVESMSSFL